MNIIVIFFRRQAIKDIKYGSVRTFGIKRGLNHEKLVTNEQTIISNSILITSHSNVNSP